MSWSFDISAAPRDRQILMRTTRGSQVYVTNWIEPTKHTPNGRFNGFSENAKSLLAWCEVPEFEESPRKAVEAVSERTAFQAEATIASAEAGVSGQPELIPTTSSERASNDGSPVVTAGETTLQFIIDDIGSGA